MLFQHFDWDLTHQVLFLNIFPSHHLNLRDQLWKMLILRCRTDICSSKFFAKVSFMLDIPFLVPSLCKLNHTSLCFIDISTKSPAKLLIPFRESNEVILGVLGRLVNFNITSRFLLRRPMFPDYSFLATVINLVFCK